MTNISVVRFDVVCLDITEAAASHRHQPKVAGTDVTNYFFYHQRNGKELGLDVPRPQSLWPRHSIQGGDDLRRHCSCLPCRPARSGQGFWDQGRTVVRYSMWYVAASKVTDLRYKSKADEHVLLSGGPCICRERRTSTFTAHKKGENPYTNCSHNGLHSSSVPYEWLS